MLNNTDNINKNYIDNNNKFESKKIKNTLFLIDPNETETETETFNNNLNDIYEINNLKEIETNDEKKNNIEQIETKQNKSKKIFYDLDNIFQINLKNILFYKIMKTYNDDNKQNKIIDKNENENKNENKIITYLNYFKISKIYFSIMNNKTIEEIIKQKNIFFFGLGFGICLFKIFKI